MKSLLQVKKDIERSILPIPEVTGVGLDRSNNTIVIYVSDYPKVRIPPIVDGYPLRIEKIGPFAPLTLQCHPSCDIKRTYKMRPVVGGISAGHYAISTGTITCAVEDYRTGEPYLLSNNHVFANISTTTHPRAQVGDPIYSPGVTDGGTEYDTIGTLDRWIDLKEDGKNIADAALIKPTDDFLAGVLAEKNVSTIRSAATVHKNISVKKYGRTTGKTKGKIVDLDFATSISYPGTKDIYFVDQILARMDVRGGDSGSLMMDNANNAVGLIFSGTDPKAGVGYALANKISSTLALLDVELL